MGSVSIFYFVVTVSGCGVQSAAESKLTSSAGGMVAAVGSALSGLPFVIVSWSSSSLPVVNIPHSSSTKQSCYTTVQSPNDSFMSVSQNSLLSTGSAVATDLQGLTCRNAVFASGVPSSMKSVPRLSRLNAVDLSVTSAADSDIAATSQAVQSTPSFTASPQTVNIPFTAVDNELSKVCDVERVISRREIAPIPGAICSAAEAARVGSSYLCSLCGKTFSSAPQLAVHRNIHYFERQFKCTICRASFASRTALEHHRSKEHHGEPESAVSTDPRPYKCDECDVAFRIQGHLAKHKRSKVHAARLENSQELTGTADAEEYASGMPLTVDERDIVEDELDECQHEASCQETDTIPVTEHEHSNSGEICYLLFCK